MHDTDYIMDVGTSQSECRTYYNADARMPSLMCIYVYVYKGCHLHGHLVTQTLHPAATPGIAEISAFGPGPILDLHRHPEHTNTNRHRSHEQGRILAPPPITHTGSYTCTATPNTRTQARTQMRDLIQICSREGKAVSCTQMRAVGAGREAEQRAGSSVAHGWRHRL